MDLFQKGFSIFLKKKQTNNNNNKKTKEKTQRSGLLINLSIYAAGYA